MNGIFREEETKIPVYIAIIVALILIAAGGYFILSSSGDQQSSSTSNAKPDNGWTYVHDLPEGRGIYKFEDTNDIVCYYAKESTITDTGSLSCLVINK